MTSHRRPCANLLNSDNFPQNLPDVLTRFTFSTYPAKSTDAQHVVDDSMACHGKAHGIPSTIERATVVPADISVVGRHLIPRQAPWQYPRHSPTARHRRCKTRGNTRGGNVAARPTASPTTASTARHPPGTLFPVGTLPSQWAHHILRHPAYNSNVERYIQPSGGATEGPPGTLFSLGLDAGFPWNLSGICPCRGASRGPCRVCWRAMSLAMERGACRDVP